MGMVKSANSVFGKFKGAFNIVEGAFCYFYLVCSLRLAIPYKNYICVFVSEAVDGIFS